MVGQIVLAPFYLIHAFQRPSFLATIDDEFHYVKYCWPLALIRINAVGRNINGKYFTLIYLSVAYRCVYIYIQMYI
jgi:hypothetical protein